MRTSINDILLIVISCFIITVIILVDLFFPFLGLFKIPLQISINILIIAVILWILNLKNNLKKVKIFVKNVENGFYKDEAYISSDDEIKDLYLDIFQMKEQLRVLNESKQESLKSITHNLKMPISIIYLTAECLHDDMIKREDLKKSYNKIMRQSKNVLNQINVLIKISKNDYLTQQGCFERERKCNLKPVVETVLDDFKIMFADKGIELEAELYNSYYFGTEEGWYSVFQNLFDNSLRYAKKNVTIKLYKENIYLFNDGLPISKKIISSIFEPYAMGTDGKTGLGLALVKSILNLYGYNINVENLDRGVLFKISESRK